MHGNVKLFPETESRGPTRAPLDRIMNHAFPFAAIAGQDEMKRALMLASIEPAIGGVLVFGDRGTGKSTAIRFWYDCPRSPWSSFPKYAVSWSSIGRSRHAPSRRARSRTAPGARRGRR